MPTQWETWPVKCEGGWITTLGRLEQGIQAPGSATTLQNYECSIEGGYDKIMGYEKFSSTAVTGTGQVVGVIATGLSKVLAYRTGIYYSSTGTAWTSEQVMPDVTATFIRHDIFNFDGSNKLVIVDGKNDPMIYNMDTDVASIDTGAPADVTGATIVKVFKNHVFFAKENLLTFTAPFAETDYTPGNGAGVINVGSEITGLIVFREELIIFSVDRIQRLTGDTLADFVLKPIASDTGCLSPDSIQEVGADVMYLGPDGIRWLSATQKNNDFGLERASSNIQDQVVRVINSNPRYTSLTIRSKSQYRLFTYAANIPREYSEGLIATKFSDQSVENLGWSLIKGMKVYGADSKQFADREVIVFCSDTDYVYKMESSGGFDGSMINTIYESPYMPITDPRIRKTIYKHTLYITLQGNLNLSCNLRFDYFLSNSIQPGGWTISSAGVTGALFGSLESLFGTAVFSTVLDEQFTNPTEGSGLTVAVRYENQSTDPSYKLGYFMLEYRENERR